MKRNLLLIAAILIVTSSCTENSKVKTWGGEGTINPDEDYAGASWTTDVRVAEGFGDKIYVGLIPNQNTIEVEQTIRTRVMNPYEYEIYVPNFDDVKIIDTYEKHG